MFAALYASVWWLVLLYLVAVTAGMVLEGLALAAIVPLIGGSGGVANLFTGLLDGLGLPASDVALVGLIAVLFVLRSIAQYCAALLGGLVVRRETVRLQVELFQLYLGLSWDEMVELGRGEVNYLLNSQTHEVAIFLHRCITLVEGLVYALGLTVVAVVISPSSTLLAVVLIGLSLLGVGALSGRVRHYAATVLAETQAQANRLLEYAAQAPLIRAYGVDYEVIREVRTTAEERERLSFRSQRVESLGWVLPDLLFVLALLSVVGVAARSGEDLAAVGAIIALLYRVSQYLKRVADFSHLSGMLPTVQAVHRHRESFRQNQAPHVHAAFDSSLPAGAIELDAVTFRYGGAPTAALDGMSLEVAPGQFVGIVGASGGGKSTLVQVIVGLLEPEQGSVRIGITTGESHGLAYVPQTPVVLSGTVATNVAWFRDLPQERVEVACEAAGLGPVLRRMPDGVETVIGQEGMTLSGGERQRLALARALAGDPRILVLDEATSALDAQSEMLIQQAIAKLHGEVTVIAVAHRLATVLSADRILVVAHGCVVEEGSPAELLKNQQSEFLRLAELQGIRI